jgi:hypothetical protein
MKKKSKCAGLAQQFNFAPAVPCFSLTSHNDWPVDLLLVASLSRICNLNLSSMGEVGKRK